jgi:hypothetical protein
MPKFKVKTPIRFEGKTFSKGDTIDLSKEEAAPLAGALENPPELAKTGDKGLQAAMDSQMDRPDPATADWKVDKPLQEQRNRERGIGTDTSKADRTAEEMEEEAELTKPPASGAPLTAVTTDTSIPAPGGTNNPGPDGKHKGDDKKK